MFDAASSGWHSLEGMAGGSPTQQLIFARACAESFVAPGDVRLVSVGDGGHLVAIAALVRTDGRLERLCQLGAAELGEFTDLLAADAHAATALAEALVNTGRPIELARVPVGSPVVEALQRAVKHRGLCFVRATSPAPYIELSEAWREPESQFNSGRRSDFRRLRKYAAKFGEVTYEVLAPTVDEVGPLLDEAIRVEMNSWKGRDGTALGVDHRRADFFRRYSAAAAQAGILRLAFMRIDGTAVGMQIALETNARFWLFKIGYDESFARCSPGNLLMLHSVRYAAERSLLSFELLGTAEPWTRTWTEQHHDCVSVKVYPAGWRGAAALARDTARQGVSRRSNAEEAAMTNRFTERRKALTRVIAERGARAYVAGPELTDAVAACERFKRNGCAATVGYFNDDGEDPRLIVDTNLSTIDNLAHRDFDAYVSIKIPSIGYDRKLLGEILDAAKAPGICIHFDSHDLSTAEPTFAAVEFAASRIGAIGCTLPGRWRRSTADADRVAGTDWRVRVVKGQWGDPGWPDADQNAGYLDVIDHLAGRQAMVAVASHNPVLSAEAIRRLRSAGTPCELELLYGLPMRAALNVAQELHVPVRVYVPFGKAWLPYALSQVKRDPRVIGRLARDTVQGLLHPGPA